MFPDVEKMPFGIGKTSRGSEKMYCEKCAPVKEATVIVVQGGAFYGFAMLTMDDSMAEVAKKIEDVANARWNHNGKWFGPHTGGPQGASLSVQASWDKEGVTILLSRNFIKVPSPVVVFDSGHAEEDLRYLKEIVEG